MPQSDSPFIAAQASGNHYAMTKRFIIVSIAALLAIAVIPFVVYEKWGDARQSPPAAMLAAMPSNADTIIFVDFASLRQSPFLAQLFSSAPRPQMDADYNKFLHDTGFDYERDLDQVAIAAIGHEPSVTYFVVADGRFDRRKINVYASQFGSHEKLAGHEVFTVPIDLAQANAAPRKLSFTFLSGDRIALTSGGDFGALLANRMSGQDAKDWRARFERLEGSSIFAVIRPDSAPGTILASHAPGGLQSPQLSSLLDQLQWVTVAGKPEGDHLRVVAEGECAADGVARQLADMLNGILLMAQAGLNGPQIRQQLDPRTRETYIDLLKTADVSRIDRGETKSVRLILDLSPNLLTVAHSALPSVSPDDHPASQPAAQPARSHRRKSK
jgi:hypothetical protein